MQSLDTIRTGQNIKNLRKKHNISINALSEKLLVSNTTVYYWERGEKMPTLDNLINIAEALHANIGEIIATKKVG